MSRIVALRVCQAAYCVPLRTGLDTCGVLLFANPEMDYFYDERRESLDMIGHQAVIAIQNARLYRDLEQEKERMIEIQEEARRKLARGVRIEGRSTRPARIELRRAGANAWLQVSVQEGRKHLVRLMFASVGHPVLKLRRIRFGGVELGALRPGRHRKLTAVRV